MALFSSLDPEDIEGIRQGRDSASVSCSEPASDNTRALSTRATTPLPDVDLLERDSPNGGLVDCPKQVDSIEQGNLLTINAGSLFEATVSCPRCSSLPVKPPRRTLSIPLFRPIDPANELLIDLTEKINSFKSCVLESEQRTNAPTNNRREASENSPESIGIAFSSHNTFEFPFFHLEPSNFTSHHESRSHKSLTVSQTPRDPFPYLHLGPQLIGSGSKRKNKHYGLPEELFNMIGLHAVKKLFLSVKDRFFEAKVSGIKICAGSFPLNLIITGNPGTGRSSVARLYAQYIRSLGIFPKRSRSIIVHDEEDRIPDFSSEEDSVYIIVGDSKQFQRVLADHEARRRFWQRIDLEDYTEDELFAILVFHLRQKGLQVLGGYADPMLRTFVRNILHRRKDNGYANVDTLLAELEKVCARQSQRLEQQTRSRDRIRRIERSSLKLTESDFLGSRPEDFFEKNESWKKLSVMVRLDKVKAAVKELVARRNINHERVRAGKAPLKVALNRIFMGKPGTGKTTVAALYAQILADLGFISSGEVFLGTPADCVGVNPGDSTQITNDLLEDTKGQVLVIDEAHMLYGGTSFGSDDTDRTCKAVVDTIVAKIDNEPGNDRCIILMGYPDLMKEFCRNTNPGFQRRFPLEDAFEFDDYDDEALRGIIDFCLAQDQLEATQTARDVALEVLRRERNGPNFGNGGAVRNLISRAWGSYSKRMYRPADSGRSGMSSDGQVILEPVDFDPDYDRGLRTSSTIRDQLSGLVGFESIMRRLEDYQRVAARMRRRHLDPSEQTKCPIPFSFVFKGPPGSGKTTTARAISHLYHSMGFLSSTEVIDCSVTDLIGQYVGHTGPKVQNLLEKAKGKVLLIDEAYRLAPTRAIDGAVRSSFTFDPLDELVDCLTKERFAGKLVIILAGYEDAMDRLLNVNEGLRGRFAEMVFPGLRPKDCLRLLQKHLSENKIEISTSKSKTKEEQQRVLRLFKKLSKTPAWANARDVETICARITGLAYLKDESQDTAEDASALRVELDDIARCLKQLYKERKPRAKGDAPDAAQKDSDDDDE